MTLDKSSFLKINSVTYVNVVICLNSLPACLWFVFQTAPSHILGQLDKVLREASTLDGVLEFRNEHFWTLSFGTLVNLKLVAFGKVSQIY